MLATRHSVQFYEVDAFLLEALASFISAALRGGEAALLFITVSHREALEVRLATEGLDLEAARASGQYIATEADTTLSEIMVDGEPDQDRFTTIVGDLIEQAESRWPGVRIFGEMVALLAAAGEYTSALRLEAFWNTLQQSRPVSLFCAYQMDQLREPAPVALMERVCDEHTDVAPPESYFTLTEAIDQRKAIAVLQEKARRLENEIAQRQRAEDELLEQTHVIETINRVGQALVSELDQDQLVQAITDAATELTGAQFGAFFYNVVNEKGEAYTLYTISGVPREAFERFPMPRNTAVFDPTFRGEGVVRIGDVTRDPRYGKNPPYYGMPKGHLPVRSYLAAPVISRSGEVLGGLFFGHKDPDVFTERAEQVLVGVAAQAAIALDNARLYRNAQDAVRLRDDFLAAASHDLKNPLGVIRGRAQLLRRQVLASTYPEARRLADGLASIDATVGKMTRLVDMLLDVTRLHLGQRFPLNLEATDLVEMTRRLVEEHQATTPRHRLHLDAEVPELVGVWDGARLERVVDNLLGNAIKYSPAGGQITVTIRSSTSGERDSATLTVRDHGIGIPASELPHVFERFRRGSNVVGRISGTGIGLAASRQIVDQHGGEIGIESEEGAGTLVCLELPLVHDTD